MNFDYFGKSSQRFRETPLILAGQVSIYMEQCKSWRVTFGLWEEVLIVVSFVTVRRTINLFLRLAACALLSNILPI